MILNFLSRYKSQSEKLNRFFSNESRNTETVLAPFKIILYHLTTIEQKILDSNFSILAREESKRLIEGLNQSSPYVNRFLLYLIQLD